MIFSACLFLVGFFFVNVSYVDNQTPNICV